MMYCKRCSIQPATKQCAGLSMCSACAELMAYKFKVPSRTIVGVDAAQPASFVPDPYSLGQQAGAAAESVSPYALGQQAGQAAASDTGAVSNVTKAVTESAKTVRTVAIVAGVAGVGILLYIFYNAQRTQARAMDLIEAHPDLLVKSGVLV